ncbi:MAG TPA: glycosyltransferase family 2 protein [Mycobacteriales bacterium]|nr:glycosyltransferase family 2 protein [Mycobacteriales bacterium]
MTVTATVVVVSWNGAHLLRRCLPALAAQRTPDGFFETVVVDNASTDGTVEMLRAEFPWVRVVANAENLGFAGGNNSALRDITTPYAVLLNNDAVPEPDWLTTLLAPFDAPGGESLGITTGKVLFLPRFLRLQLTTEGFTPGGADPRELGVRIHAIERDGTDVTGELLWDALTFGPEAGFRWTRTEGELLLPVDGPGPWKVTIRAAGERAKPLAVSWAGGQAVLDVPADEPGDLIFTVGPEARLVDVINNVGGVMLSTGYGADRGYQRVDEGQYDQPSEVFGGCGNGMAMRSEPGHATGWFDDDFFLYYEDTDLSWRIRALGYSAQYVPGAVLRHEHAASSGEWSPLFVFHVDRNRLLNLIKNATRGLALREVARYPLTTLSLLRQRRLSKAQLRLRIRVLLSLLRLLPVMLVKRRRIRRTAKVDRVALQQLMTPFEAWQRGAD